ncbi:MAG: DUF5320 domain-containing protein [Nitrosarchaeum sp.]|nr:DUF5320 domain-containing protein [Nitrosarchaeum sp.]
MPNRDRTGPEGKGPRTGRGRGASLRELRRVIRPSSGEGQEGCAGGVGSNAQAETEAAR